MAEYKAKRNPDRCPSHPGAVLDNIMPSLGKPKAEIARLLGISRQQRRNARGKSAFHWLVVEFNPSERSATMSKVQKIIVKDPLGTRNGKGYVIDIDELRLLLE